MENISDDFIGNIYTSYGPIIGKVCENTNNILNANNIVNELTSSDINIYSSLEKRNLNNLSGITKVPLTNSIELNLKNNNINSSKAINNLKNTIEGVKVIKIKGGSSMPSKDLPNLLDGIKGGSSVPSKDLPNILDGIKGGSSMPSKDLPNILDDTLNNQENNDSSYFNFKVSLFGHNISIWIIILMLLVLICIGYFIYKYFFTYSKNLIAYKKNNNRISNEILNSLEDEIDTNTELSQVSNSTKISKISDKSSKSSDKSSKSSDKSSKSSK